MTARIGPQIPATASERVVWRDWLLERGITPPWPIEEKPTTVKGHMLAARAAEAMAKMAAANAVLANLEEQRTAAELDVKNAEESLERLGINSISQLTGISGQREYSVCSQPGCERVALYSWRSEGPNWRCDEHELPPETAPIPAPAVTEEPSF